MPMLDLLVLMLMLAVTALWRPTKVVDDDEIMEEER